MAGCVSNCRLGKVGFDSRGVAWRIDTSAAGVQHIKDLKGRHTDTGLPDDVKDVVVRKKDGNVSYQLASLADDVFYGVDLVVRGADLFSSTAAQLFLARTLGLDDFLNVTFHHHTLLTGSEGQKLSKSAGDTSVREMIRGGKTREEIRNLAFSLSTKDL